jgi:hypothetical protein
MDTPKSQIFNVNCRFSGECFTARQLTHVTKLTLIAFAVAWPQRECRRCTVQYVFCSERDRAEINRLPASWFSYRLD